MTPKRKVAEKKSPIKSFLRGEQMGARRTVIEEMFNDYYADRRNIYLVNFVRGIFFGLGSVIGGTIVIALIIWSLSLFVHVPGIGPAVQDAQDTLQSNDKKK